MPVAEIDNYIKTVESRNNLARSLKQSFNRANTMRHKRQEEIDETTELEPTNLSSEDNSP